MNHNGNGDLTGRFEAAVKAEPASSDLGPMAQRFFRTLIAIGFFLAPPLLLYTLYVLISVFLFHKSP